MVKSSGVSEENVNHGECLGLLQVNIKWSDTYQEELVLVQRKEERKCEHGLVTY